jgi:hypothetical protein
MVTAMTPTQELVARLVELQTEAGLSDRQFVAEKLGGRISNETWGRVKAGDRPFTLKVLRAVSASYPRLRSLVNRVVNEEAI